MGHPLLLLLLLPPSLRQPFLFRFVPGRWPAPCCSFFFVGSFGVLFFFCHFLRLFFKQSARWLSPIKSILHSYRGNITRSISIKERVFFYITEPRFENQSNQMVFPK